MAVFLRELFQALGQIARPDNDIRPVSLGKGIHILDKNLMLGQLLQNLRQRTGHVRTTAANHIGQNHCEIYRTLYFYRLVYVGHNQTKDTEIRSLRHTESVHVDTLFTQSFGHFVDSPAFVFQENG